MLQTKVTHFRERKKKTSLGSVYTFNKHTILQPLCLSVCLSQSVYISSLDLVIFSHSSLQNLIF